MTGIVEGLGGKRRIALARAWREQRMLRDVILFLQVHGASAALAARIVRRYGSNAMAVVSRDPYRLALDVHGVGFKTADRIAAGLGVAPDSPARMQAGTNALEDAGAEVSHDPHEAADLVPRRQAAGHGSIVGGGVVGRA